MGSAEVLVIGGWVGADRDAWKANRAEKRDEYRMLSAR